HVARVLVAHLIAVFKPGSADGLLRLGTAWCPPERAAAQPNLHSLDKTLHIRALNSNPAIRILAHLGDLHGLQGGEIAQGKPRKSLLEMHHSADQHVLSRQ